MFIVPSTIPFKRKNKDISQSHGEKATSKKVRPPTKLHRNRLMSALLSNLSARMAPVNDPSRRPMGLEDDALTNCSTEHSCSSAMSTVLGLTAPMVKPWMNKMKYIVWQLYISFIIISEFSSIKCVSRLRKIKI